MLEARQVTKRYTNGSDAAVKEVCLHFNADTIYAIVGESGCGKSTLARILGGILPPDSGEILYGNKSVYPLTKEKKRQYLKHTQLVLQDSKSALDPRCTVYDTLSEPLLNFEKLSKKDKDKRIRQLLQYTDLTDDLLARYPNELSGGQQKRVCIARALAISPDTIIFDEAVSGLDTIVQKHILKLLLTLQKQTKGCVIFITHDMGVALFVADEIIVMKEGRVIEQTLCNKGSPVFQEEYARLLLNSAFYNQIDE